MPGIGAPTVCTSFAKFKKQSDGCFLWGFLALGQLKINVMAAFYAIFGLRTVKNRFFPSVWYVQYFVLFNLILLNKMFFFMLSVSFHSNLCLSCFLSFRDTACFAL